MAKNIVINEFSTALVQKKGAIFIGAGISVPSGFKSWVELLREMQEDIDLEIDDHLDLTEVAQFIVNNNLNNKIYQPGCKPGYSTLHYDNSYCL